jgi:chromosome segregation ATPase
MQLVTPEELKSWQRALETAKEESADATAKLVSLQQMYEEDMSASMDAQEDLMEQIKGLQQSVLLAEADADARSAELDMLREQQANDAAREQQAHESALERQKAIEEEIDRLQTDLNHAEAREDGLLQQVQTLENTVHELSEVMDAMQADSMQAGHGEVRAEGLIT